MQSKAIANLARLGIRKMDGSENGWACMVEKNYRKSLLLILKSFSKCKDSQSRDEFELMIDN